MKVTTDLSNLFLKPNHSITHLKYFPYFTYEGDQSIITLKNANQVQSKFRIIFMIGEGNSVSLLVQSTNMFRFHSD